MTSSPPANTLVEIELALRSGHVLTARVRLQGSSRHHEGPETLEDLVCHGRRFLPIVDDDAGSRETLIGLDQVRWARCPRTGNVLQALERAACDPVDAELELDDGSVVRGLVYVTLEDSESPLHRHLERAPRFITVIQPDSELYVRRESVAVLRAERTDLVDLAPESRARAGLPDPSPSSPD
jgi:hypothetical protein